MKLLFPTFLVALGTPLLVAADQLRFANPSASTDPITSFSSSTKVLNSHSSKIKLSEINSPDGFTTLEHDGFPSHSIRIKETTGWCDPDVNSYSGYLDVGNGKDLFFYFFESRSKPDEDDVIMWINGGPGCSSSLGLFMELGPCSVVDGEGEGNLTTKVNPYAWNDKANVFFLDEPIGVGFSYAEHGQMVGRAEQAAVDVQAFIAIFFETFKEFKGRKLHLAGESYGGRYLPVFAAAVYDGNKALVAAGSAPINLKSVMIGNGITDAYSMQRGYYEHSCTNSSGTGPLLSVTSCQQMALALPRCEEMMKADCLDRSDLIGCQNAMEFCGNHIGGPFWGAQLNPYDVSKPCTMKELSDSLCYPITKKINKYLDLPHVRKQLGVSPHLGSFSSCSPLVGQAFNQAADGLGKTWYYVAALLEHGVDVLTYIGKFDWICNSSGNYIWTDALEWSGHDEFSSQKLRDWHVDGEVAGQTRSAKGLTYLTVNGAGHMVPTDKPKEALQMVNNWIAGKKQ